MASIHKEILVDCDPDRVWDALRDWGVPHERLVAGFVTGTVLDGSDRIVTFFNGAVAREVLVDLDDERRRLVWSVVDGPLTHHNGCAQVHEAPDGRTRFVWVADLLPDAAAAAIDEMMERGIEAVRRTLESAPSRAA